MGCDSSTQAGRANRPLAVRALESSAVMMPSDAGQLERESAYELNLAATADGGNAVNAVSELHCDVAKRNIGAAYHTLRVCVYQYTKCDK